jgi:hypothetical protein
MSNPYNFSERSSRENLFYKLRIGKTDGTQAKVLSGIAEGEKYISKAEGKVRNGVKVVY